jgi:hypothetical protein
MLVALHIIKMGKIRQGILNGVRHSCVTDGEAPGDTNKKPDARPYAGHPVN